MNGEMRYRRARGGRMPLVAMVLCLLLGLAGAPSVRVAAATPAGASPPAQTGDPRAAQDDYYGERLTQDGQLSGTARANALRQAQGLPVADQLPAAANGQGARPNGTVAPPTANWQPLGPAPQDSDQANPAQDYRVGNVSGRTTAVVVGPHTGVIYIGTAGGGTWKSTDGGANWTPLTDNQLSLAVGSLALDPVDLNDTTLYVGTGEANYAVPVTGGTFNGDAYFGVGVLKTTDGGATWARLGAATFGDYSANALGIGALVANGPVVWAATTAGLFKSADSGANWARVPIVVASPALRVTEVIVDGTNVYAVISQAVTGNASAGIYKSLDGGATFASIMTGLPAATNWKRAQAAIARSNTQVLYLAIANGSDNLLGIYKTSDGGATWALTTAQPTNYFNGGGGGQGFYDNTIAVDPADANLVYAGGVNLVASATGGTTWATIADVYCGGAFPCHGPLHPDQHALAFGPTGTPRPLYIANDGGLWKTTNGNQGAATTYTDLNGNLATTEFYAGDSAANYQTTPIVAAGAQDNGTSRSASATLGPWGSILGGDGGFVAIDKTNPNIIYAEYQNGALNKTTNANAGPAITWTDIKPSTISGVCTNGTVFVAPFAMDPQNSSHLVFGAYNEVCETLNGGGSWHRSATFGTIYSMRAVAIAPSNSAVLYAGSRGHVYRTTVGNQTTASAWTECGAGTLPAAPNPTTSIAVDANDPTIAYVTFGNFGIGHVFKSVNCGPWTNISGNLPDAPTLSIVTYASTPNPTLIVGTDVGIFLSANNGASWSSLKNGSLPNVPIQQLFFDKSLTTLFAATHGRGIWTVPIPAGATTPTLTALAPSSVAEGGAAFTLTVAGSGFNPAMTVRWNGADRPTTYVDATHLSATIPATDIGDGPTTTNVTVHNPGPDTTTTALPFTITNAPPGAVFTAPGQVNQGAALALALTSPTDPSTADTAAGFTYAFDCGTGGGYGPTASTTSTTCSTATAGIRTVKGKILDKDGGATEYTASVTVIASPSATPSPTPSPAPVGFADVPPGYWAHDQIGQFAQRGITTGCGDNDQGQRLYCPERGVTRAEMATFLTRALGQDKQAPPAIPTFADVPADYWAYGQIEAFAKLGITTGCGLDELGRRLFCPDRGVTRAEMAAFLDRAKAQVELTPASPTFADVPANYWAYGWIERFFTLGITTGCGTDDGGNKVYCPDRGVTRAEMAVFIIRAYP